MSIDQIRRDFMEKMDKLWTNDFDFAFKTIPEDSATAYKSYADYLDDFFVCYWAFFHELNKGSPIEKLQEVSKRKHEESIHFLEKVWLVTADAQFEKAIRLKRKRRHKGAAFRFKSMVLQSTILLKEARKIDSIDKRLRKYREAARLLAKFNRMVGKS